MGVIDSAEAGAYQDNPSVDQFISELAANDGFSSKQLHNVFSKAERKQAILDAISKPAEKVKQWHEYRPIFITPQRTVEGVAFWRKNERALMRAEKKYGVSAQFIVAIIGIETFYGKNTGHYRVIDALSTLAFDYPKRSPFFRKELREFLILSREEKVDPLTLKGSYAGAMGLGQFMPSSFRAYAVDFDHDGHINIWSNPTDAIGSVANYFKQHGWVAGEDVVTRAKVSGNDFEQGLSPNLEPVMNVAQLQKLGWQSTIPLKSELPITAFRLNGSQGSEYWMGLPNFYVITRYNHSIMYAMAANQLAESIVDMKGSD
ncbi:UNVERIFIED_CONTAM: hypothetical protein GTU68_034674 [Idotea baltica]|nr:hypothetical protein [Idotea baltica]